MKPTAAQIRARRLAGSTDHDREADTTFPAAAPEGRAASPATGSKRPSIPRAARFLALEVWRWDALGHSVSHKYYVYPASKDNLDLMLRHGTLVTPFEPDWAWAVLAVHDRGQIVLACSASSRYAVGDLINVPDREGVGRSA